MAAPDFANFRSVCMLSQVNQFAELDNPLIDTQYVNPVTLRANIVPMKTAESVAGTQLNPDVDYATHYAETYTIPNVDIFDILQRKVNLADGSYIQETYRVLGAMFIDQECRFIKMDLQLQTSVSSNGN